MERTVFSYFNKRALLRVRNTTAEHVELIYEMPRKIWQMNYQKDTDISDALYALGGTEYVNTVTAYCGISSTGNSPRRMSWSPAPSAAVRESSAPICQSSASRPEARPFQAGRYRRLARTWRALLRMTNGSSWGNTASVK